MTYTCIECNKIQTLSDRERQFFDSKGWEYPKRCKECRQKKKERAEASQEENYYYSKPSWMR